MLLADMMIVKFLDSWNNWDERSTGYHNSYVLGSNLPLFCLVGDGKINLTSYVAYFSYLVYIVDWSFVGSKCVVLGSMYVGVLSFKSNDSDVRWLFRLWSPGETAAAAEHFQVAQSLDFDVQCSTFQHDSEEPQNSRTVGYRYFHCWFWMSTLGKGTSSSKAPWMVMEYVSLQEGQHLYNICPISFKDPSHAIAMYCPNRFQSHLSIQLEVGLEALDVQELQSESGAGMSWRMPLEDGELSSLKPTYPLKIGRVPIGNFIFQPSIFSYVSFREGIFHVNWCCYIEPRLPCRDGNATVCDCTRSFSTRE